MQAIFLALQNSSKRLYRQSSSLQETISRQALVSSASPYMPIPRQGLFSPKPPLAILHAHLRQQDASLQRIFAIVRNRDAHNQRNRNRPIDFDYYKIAPSDSD